MWLHDPYVIDELLRRHAELLAADRRPEIDGRPLVTERLALALRVLRDATFAARVRDALPGRPGAADGRPIRTVRA